MMEQEFLSRLLDEHRQQNAGVQPIIHISHLKVGITIKSG
jgi:hypothetical protein